MNAYHADRFPNYAPIEYELWAIFPRKCKRNKAENYTRVLMN